MSSFRIIVDGTSYDLNKHMGGLYLADVEGLGVKFSNTYADISDGFQLLTKRQETLGQIVGTIYAIGRNNRTAYATAQSFLNAVNNADSVVICYTPLDTEYMADVKLSYFTRSPAGAGYAFGIPVAFDLLSMWYTETTESSCTKFTVTDEGQATAAIQLEAEYQGWENPVVYMRIAGSTTYLNTLTIDGTLSGKLKYSTFPEDCYVKDGDDDAIDMVDISTPIFERTEKSFIVSTTQSFNIKVRKYWRTV